LAVFILVKVRWSYFLNAASALGVKELLPPYLKKDLSLEELKTGVSFASAGSGYDNSTCRTMVSQIASNRDQ
jgi:hypothetical protein